MSDKHQLKRKGKRQIKNTAGYLVNRLKERGFVVQRYDSFTSNSIYLKLDYGVCNSIRISDHKGKPHLSYRYNILTCCPERIATTDQKGNIKLYFPIKERDVLLTKIAFDREEKMARFGQNYQNIMHRNREKGSKKKGFWQKAKVV